MQAAWVARMTSTPWVFRGEVEGRNTRGMASVTLAVEGKVMTREREVREVDRAREVVALQGRERVVALVVAQDPALVAVVLELLRQVQEVHPVVSTAVAEQQQDPRHRLVPQSALLAQACPGEYRAHSPQEVQLEHPRRRALALQVVVELLEELTPPT